MIPAIIVINIIIMVHEFGHFLLARLNGVPVAEFSVGFGPRLLSCVSKKSGTRYSLKLILFGGSCAMIGFDEEAGGGETGIEKSESGQSEIERLAAVARSGSAFYSKPPLARFMILAAGPAFNFLLAFVLAIGIVAWAGYDHPQLVGVMEGYPAEAAGLQAGDVVTKIGNRSVGLMRDITYYLMVREGQPVSVGYKHYNEETSRWEKHSTVLVPKYSEENHTYYLGLQWNAYRKPAEHIGQLLLYGFYEVRTQVRGVIDSLEMVIKGKVTTDDIAGPVRIVTVIGDSVEQTRQYGLITVIMNLVNLTVMLSANLGVMNLLPIPAFDGGRLLFCLWEMITKKPVDSRFENAVSTVGMALLMTLMVFVVFNDLKYLF